MVKEFRDTQWRVKSIEQCYAVLKEHGKPVNVTDPSLNGTLSCPAVWDMLYCWPATVAGGSQTYYCPKANGVDPEKRVTKMCQENGQWEGASNMSMAGKTPYLQQCLYIPFEVAEKAQALALTNRKFEFVGLFLSFTTLILSIAIFLHFKRLRVFRNHLHVQLKLAILAMCTIRLCIYLDQLIAPDGPNQTPSINNSKIVCETFYVLLEYAKTVAYMWMVLEGYYLHQSLVVSVFSSEPKLFYYCIIGWCVPAAHVAIWLLVMIVNADFDVPICLHGYYYDTEMWILDGVRMIYIVVNIGFLANIIRVLWVKVKQSHTSTETERLKKSVKAAFMLIPLLGIPNILQLIPVEPTKEGFAGWVTYQVLGTIFYMFQGFFISLLYCFTNREVIDCLKSFYHRFKMRHVDLRRGSRSASLAYSTMFTATKFDKNSNNRSATPETVAAGKRTSSPRTEVSTCTTAHVENGKKPIDADKNGAATFEVEPLIDKNAKPDSTQGLWNIAETHEPSMGDKP